MQWTILKLLEWTEQYFKKQDIKSQALSSPAKAGDPSLRCSTYRTDAELLLANVLGKRRIDLYVAFDQEVSEKDLARYKELIQRRAEQEPIQYILEKQEFWSLNFKVGPGVLIPRPETECLIEEAIKLLGLKKETSLTFLEIGTGSGAISVALAKEFPMARIHAMDISAEALHYAKENAAIHGVSNQINFYEKDIFDAELKESYDLIISNPPYVTNSEWEGLEKHLKDFEPQIAFKGGSQGINFHKYILKIAPRYLKQGGFVILEIVPTQTFLLKNYLIQEKLFQHFYFTEDYSHRERVLIAHG